MRLDQTPGTPGHATDCRRGDEAAAGARLEQQARLRGAVQHLPGVGGDDAQTQGKFGRRKARLAAAGGPLHGGGLPVAGAERVDRRSESLASRTPPGRVEHLAAAERRLGRGPADDEAVAANRHQGLVEPDLGHGFLAGHEPGGVERPQLADPLRGVHVKPHRAAAVERFGRRGEQPAAHEQGSRGAVDAGGGQLVAAGDLLEIDADELERRALAGLRLLAAVAVDLDAAYAGTARGWQDVQFVADGHGAPGEGAGDQHAESPQVKGPVDRQPDGQTAIAIDRCRRPGKLHQGRAEPFQAFAGLGRHRQDRRAGEGGSGQGLLELQLGELHEVGRHEVRFRQHRQAGGDPEQRADREVLQGLRHDPLVGGHDQHHHLNAAEPSEGVVDEPFVAGHVDEADLPAVLDHRGEAEVDRDAALLLLFPAVAVDPGQGLDQPRLAVIDVAGGADDEPVGDHPVHEPRSGSMP